MPRSAIVRAPAGTPCEGRRDVEGEGRSRFQKSRRQTLPTPEDAHRGRRRLAQTRAAGLPCVSSRAGVRRFRSAEWLESAPETRENATFPGEKAAREAQTGAGSRPPAFAEHVPARLLRPRDYAR